MYVSNLWSALQVFLAGLCFGMGFVIAGNILRLIGSLIGAR